MPVRDIRGAKHHVLRHLAVGEAVRLRRSRAGAPPGRASRLQEVGPEGDDVPGRGEIVVPAAPRVPKSCRLAARIGSKLERLVADQPGRPAPRSRRRGRSVKVPRPAPLSTATLPPAPCSFWASSGDRLVPGDLLEACRPPGGPSGPCRPAGIVEPLKCRLPVGAELARVDGMLGIAFELDRPALAGLHVQPAASRALGAGAGVPGRRSRAPGPRTAPGRGPASRSCRWSSRRPAAAPAPVTPRTVRKRRAVHAFAWMFVGHCDRLLLAVSRRAVGHAPPAIVQEPCKPAATGSALPNRLVMTRRTIAIDLPLDVAGDAEAHVVHVVHLEHLRHAGDVAVAGLAGVGPRP